MKTLNFGQILPDNGKRWIVGAFLYGGNGIIESYEAAPCDDKTPTDYPAILQIVPYADQPISFQFYLNFAKPDELDRHKNTTKARHLGIPVLLGEGNLLLNNQKYKFIIIERHGKDLWSLFSENGKKFKAHTAFKITIQMLTILRYIHSKSYFQNYISGLDIVVDVATQNHIYLINKYVAPEYVENNIALRSRDFHNGVQTRRGDMEMLFYNLVQWLGIELPWEKNLENPSLVIEEKENAFTDVDKFIQKTKIPSPVSEFMRLIGEMEPFSEPKYSNFTRILTKGLRSLHHMPYGELDFRISNESIVGHVTEAIVVESKQKDNVSDEEVIERDKSESVDCHSWHDKYNMLNAWLKMREQNFDALGSILSEPQMVTDQVQQVRVLLEEFHRSPRLRQLNKLKGVLSKLLPSSDDAQKIEQVVRSWQELLDRLMTRGRELGEASLGQLRKALYDVSNNLKKLLLDELSEQLLTELNALAEHLKSVQRTLLANAKTSVDQLCRALRNLTVKSNLESRLLLLKNLNEHLQKEIEDKINSLVESREFDKLCKETDDWLVKRLANVLLVPTDRKKLQQQHEDYKVEHQLIMDKETEVMELLKRGRDSARLRNTTQRQFLDLIESRWNQLTKQSHDIVNKLKTCAEICDEFYEKQDCFLRWLIEAECKLESIKLASLDSIEKQLKELYEFRDEVQGKSAEFEQITSLGETFVSACEDNNDLTNELSAAEDRWTNLNFDLRNRLQSFEDMNEHFTDFNKSLLDLQQKIDPYEKESASHDALEATAKDSKLLLRIRELEKQMTTLQKPLDAVRQKADDLVLKARERGINVSHLWDVVNLAAYRIENCKSKLCDIRNEIVELEQARFLEDIQIMKPVESRDSFSKDHSERRQGGDFETNSPRRSEKKSESRSRKRRIQSKDSHKNDNYNDARLNSDINPFIRKRFKNSRDDLDRNSRISRYEGSRQEKPCSHNRRIHCDSDRNPSRSSNYRRHWRPYRSRRPVYDSRSGWRSRSPGRNQTWDVQQKQPFKNIAGKNSVYGQATRARYRRRDWKPNFASEREQ